MGDTATVRAAEHLSSEIYPLGQHRPKFMFLEAVTRLQGGETERFLATLKELVQQYPQNEITDLAAHILKGVQEGRLLARDSHTFGSIWQRRSAELAEAGNLLGDSSSSTAILPPDSAFSTERNVPFLFILAYEEGKVNENMLLFEVARYNFSTFLVKNFDLAFAHERVSVCCKFVRSTITMKHSSISVDFMQIPKWRHGSVVCVLYSSRRPTMRN